jgi:hypothetical protein
MKIATTTADKERIAEVNMELYKQMERLDRKELVLRRKGGSDPRKCGLDCNIRKIKQGDDGSNQR